MKEYNQAIESAFDDQWATTSNNATDKDAALDMFTAGWQHRESLLTSAESTRDAQELLIKYIGHMEHGAADGAGFISDTSVYHELWHEIHGEYKAHGGQRSPTDYRHR